MAAPMCGSLRSRILESLPKHSNVPTVIKHYEKMSVAKHFLRKVQNLKIYQ